jgi:hypothetical protein
MRLTKNHLRKLILKEFKIILEEEGDEAEAEEEEEVEEEAGEDTEDSEDLEPAVETTPEEEAQLSKSADDQILSHIIGYETNAIKSAAVLSDDQLRPNPDGQPIDIADVSLAQESRWWKSRLANVLLEDATEGEATSASQVSWVGSPNIDIAVFSSDVARLVMNYDSLIDMEAHIINKARNYIIDKYDEETADYFIEKMDVEHDMRPADAPTLDGQNEVPNSPPALGSGFASQIGGGG